MHAVVGNRPGLSAVELEILGQNLPERLEELLRSASRESSRPDLVERDLGEAARLAPDHAAVLIARYRFFFFQGRLEDALDVADLCLAKALRENGLGSDWRTVRPDQAAFGDWGAVLPRFFLFSLKGWAYLRMRLGDLPAGRRAVDKLLELDPTDKVGAKVLLDVLVRRDRDDDD